MSNHDHVKSTKFEYVTLRHTVADSNYDYFFVHFSEMKSFQDKIRFFYILDIFTGIALKDNA